MNYFPFHIGDYASHTRHLTMLQDLAYRRLLDRYYTTEGPLPADVDRLVGMGGDPEALAAVQLVLGEFFHKREAGGVVTWAHCRCDSELERMQAKSAKARESALMGVEARAKRNLSVRSASAQRTPSVRPANGELPTPTPTPTPTKEERRRATRLPQGFVCDPLFAKSVGVIDIEREAANFRDYWAAKPGREGTKLDWAATWRVWCRKAKTSPTGYPSLVPVVAPKVYVPEPIPVQTEEQHEATRLQLQALTRRLKAKA